MSRRYKITVSWLEESGEMQSLYLGRIRFSDLTWRPKRRNRCRHFGATHQLAVYRGKEMRCSRCGVHASEFSMVRELLTLGMDITFR